MRGSDGSVGDGARVLAVVRRAVMKVLVVMVVVVIVLMMVIIVGCFPRSRGDSSLSRAPLTLIRLWVVVAAVVFVGSQKNHCSESKGKKIEVV